MSDLPWMPRAVNISLWWYGCTLSYLSTNHHLVRCEVPNVAIPTIELGCHNDNDCCADTEDHCHNHEVVVIPALLQPCYPYPKSEKYNNHSNR
jgi:hypothetical protein